jgi:hypothetical protein
METGFSDNSPRTYFYDKEGKIVVGKKDNQTTHDSFAGYLQGIQYQEKEIEFQAGKPTLVKSWLVIFSDNDGNEHVWSTRYTGLTFQSFINSISSLDEYSGLLRIGFYLKNDRTKIYTRYNGEKLSWKYSLDEMPAVEPVMVKGKPYKDQNGNTVYDFDERMEWTKKLVDRVNKILGFDPNAKPAEKKTEKEPAMADDEPGF